jgi:DNA repair exonuclease SbcCD nuclease subunit
MKILFTADIHIKLGQKNVPIDWAKNRYNELFRQLDQIMAEELPDYFIIGGDIFDRLPTMEELEIFFNFIGTVLRPVKIIIYSGNHEAVKKDSTFLSNLKGVVSLINSNATIIDNYWCLKDANIDIIPYNRLKDFANNPVEFHGDILCTHVRGEIPPHVKPEVPLELFDRWKVVLAGDLHSYSNSQRNILYPGSPVTTSFHRHVVDTGVIILDTETLSHTWKKLELPQLIRKTVSSKKDMVKTYYHHTIYELEGNLAELSESIDSELLDKKIVQKGSPAILNLTKNMTLEEELALYLKDIQKMDTDKIKEILGVFNDIVKTVDLE